MHYNKYKDRFLLQLRTLRGIHRRQSIVRHSLDDGVDDDGTVVGLPLLCGRKYQTLIRWQIE